MIQRRTILKTSALMISTAIAGTPILITPRQARATGAKFKTLTAAEVLCLEALADVLLPGARAAGVAHFVDDQLVKPPEDNLLLLRYLNVTLPAREFYGIGLAAMDEASRRERSRSFAELTREDASALVRQMQKNQITGWRGPSASTLYVAIRGDCIDVLYDGHDGATRLGIPMLGHTAPPPARW